jgi:hypothetical protein
VTRSSIDARTGRGITVGSRPTLFATTRPERTSAVVLVNTTARYLAADDYPIGISREVAEADVAKLEQAWGTEALVPMFVPSRAGDPRFCRWLAKLQRTIASPGAMEAYLRALFELDARPLLPLVQAPTLVLHRRDFQLLPIEPGHYLAEHIPGARLVELPGADGPLMWETPELALDLIQEFLTGTRRHLEPGRVLATGCWPPSMGPAAGSAARPRSETSCAASASSYGRACTPARWNCATATSAALPCTSRPGRWRQPGPGRSWPPGPYGTWWWVRISSCTIVGRSD